MSASGTAGVITMKATAVFPQSNTHIPVQHTQGGTLQHPSAIHSTNTTSQFNQQMQQQQQQQHLLQQQRVQQQHAQQVQHSSQLHRLPQSVSVPPTATATVGNTQTSVFPNAEFLHTLQQTAAAALPTVLPYDQSQYIGPLMYFPYPSAANGLFSTPVTSDSQHITVGSTATTTMVNPTSTNHLLGSASLVSATSGGMVTLNHAGGNTSSGQVQGQILAPGSGLVGLSTGTAPTTTPTLTSASLAPLLTTAHFYQQSDQNNQSLHLQHSIQQHHSHAALQVQQSQQQQQHIQSLPGHTLTHAQSMPTTTVLLPGQVHHSTLAPSNIVRQLNSAGTNGNSTPNIKVGMQANNKGNNGIGGSCDSEDRSHSTPNQTPLKGSEADLMNQNSQLTNQSQNSNSGHDASSSSTKRDNNGTGHFVCGVCGREFGMRCRLIAHTRRHTGERPFPCADCGRAFSDRGNLQRHRYTHSSQPRFHCIVCGKSFRQASCLSNHRRFHCAGANGRPCPFCQRSFRSSSSLQMHIRWKHRADAAAAVAAATAASYLPASSVNGCLDFQGSSLLSAAAAVAASAAIVNNGVGVAGCNVMNQLCNTTTTTATGTAPSNVLNPFLHTAHSPNKRKWRRKPKPRQNAFGKLTGDGMNILAGINLSEGIDVNAAAAAAGAAAAAVGGPVPLDRKGRPCNFPCPACPRRFAFQCRLAAHLRCHTNIRPFICIDCGRAFTQRGYLVRHAAVHKLDRPFTCVLCDRSYKHYGSLVNHKRTHSKLTSHSGFGNLALLSGSNALHQLQHCGDPNINTLTGFSSLEDVVGGTVGRLDKNDASNGTLGITSNSTSITLLPVTKVEEILPSEMGAMQQVCVRYPPSTTALHNSDGGAQQQQQQQQQHAQAHSLPHQLTATAVWPILASGSANTPHNTQQMLASASMPQSMASHFPSLTISPQIGGVQSGQVTNPGQQQHHHLSLIPSSHRQLHGATNGHMLAAAAAAAAAASATPTFVTVPLFGGHHAQSDTTTEASMATTHPTHHSSFHTASTGGTTSVPVSSSHAAAAAAAALAHVSQASVTHHHPVTSNPSAQPNHSAVALSQPQQQQPNTTGDASSTTTPVLHVLQPSPSIFFSPYCFPPTATSQM